MDDRQPYQLPDSLVGLPWMTELLDRLCRETNVNRRQIEQILDSLHVHRILRENRTYNGWDRYETWCAYTWLTNDERTYRHCRGLAHDAVAVAPICSQVHQRIWTVAEARRFLLADSLKAFVEDKNVLAETASLYSDLLDSAISEINWHDLADAFLDEMPNVSCEG